MKKIKSNADFFNQYGLFIDRNQEINIDLIDKSISQDEKYQLKINVVENDKTTEIVVYRIITDDKQKAIQYQQTFDLYNIYDKVERKLQIDEFNCHFQDIQLIYVLPKKIDGFDINSIYCDEKHIRLQFMNMIL